MRNFINSIPWSEILLVLLSILGTVLAIYAKPFIEGSSLEGVRKRKITRLSGRIKKLRFKREFMQQLQEVGDFEATSFRLLFETTTTILLSLVFLALFFATAFSVVWSSLSIQLSLLGKIMFLVLLVMLVAFALGIVVHVWYSWRSQSLLANYPVTDGEIENVSTSIADLERRLEKIERQ